MRVFLTGFMGAGKSTVGRLLAERSGLAFVDLDRAIEEATGESIQALFDAAGEVGFRRLEAAALRAVEAFEEVVVATGGGVPVDPENRSWMRSRGTVVWLDVPGGILADRLAETPTVRPLLAESGDVEGLLASRLPAYGDCDLRLSLRGDETPEEVVERVRRALADHHPSGPPAAS